jgi:hypothetical protein
MASTKEMQARARARRQAESQPTNKQSGISCHLLIKKTDKRDGSVEFQYGLIDIPNKPFGDRSKLIGSLGFEWAHDYKALQVVAAYLSHSPSLMMMRMGMAKNILDINSGHMQNMDVNNLACYIEFEADKRGVYTQGPKWMTPAETDRIGKELETKYSATHDIKKAA